MEKPTTGQASSVERFDLADKDGSTAHFLLLECPPTCSTNEEVFEAARVACPGKKVALPTNRDVKMVGRHVRRGGLSSVFKAGGIVVAFVGESDSLVPKKAPKLIKSNGWVRRGDDTGPQKGERFLLREFPNPPQHGTTDAEVCSSCGGAPCNRGCAQHKVADVEPATAPAMCVLPTAATTSALPQNGELRLKSRVGRERGMAVLHAHRPAAGTPFAVGVAGFRRGLRGKGAWPVSPRRAEAIAEEAEAGEHPSLTGLTLMLPNKLSPGPSDEYTFINGTNGESDVRARFTGRPFSGTEVLLASVENKD